MLELRPACENCQRPLPPESRDARICSFECTFCADCEEKVLQGVCANCGGNLCPRPVRPARNWRGDNFLGKYPAATKSKQRPVDAAAHAQLRAQLADLPPERR